MSAFAYKDAQRQYRVEATDAQPGQCEYYFCPQEGCGARMHLVRAENPYFSANKGYGHAWNCIYASGNFDHSKYDRENFAIEDFIKSLLRESADAETGQRESHSAVTSRHSKILQIRTLKTLYGICKSINKNEFVGSTPVYSILLDDRTVDNAPIENGVFRLVECRTTNNFLEYDNGRLEINNLKGPKDRNRLKLSFDNRTIYREVNNEMYNHRKQGFVVAGLWEKDEQSGSYICKVINNKQVFVVKN